MTGARTPTQSPPAAGAAARPGRTTQTSTITAAPRTEDPAAAAGQPHARLVFVADADQLALPSSYHSLDGLAEVRFRRGPRRAERSAGALSLWFPDPWISGDHGGLVRRGDHWALEDPASKNGSVVDGLLLRKAVLRDGAVIELGHSFLVFRQTCEAQVPEHLCGDLEATQLPAWPAGMATFSVRLAREYAMLLRFAASSTSIVLRGETGTGKEVIARAIHGCSQRTGALVAVNCGALPDQLLESELFGHRRGAFSGAIADRKGLVRSADGGTLLLDEIGELPMASQAALLRVLQEREVLPLGDDRPVAVDLRVIAATLRDLEAAIGDGRFRADLLARLAGHVVELPALRERREDLGLLLARLMPRGAGGALPRMDPAALRALLRHDWPNNIRELEQVLARATTLANGAMLALEHLPDRVVARSPAPPPTVEDPPPAKAPGARDARSALDDGDRALRDDLIRLLHAHGGNVVRVARALGKQRPQIYKWVERFEIDLSRFRRDGAER